MANLQMRIELLKHSSQRFMSYKYGELRDDMKNDVLKDTDKLLKCDDDIKLRLRELRRLGKDRRNREFKMLTKIEDKRTLYSNKIFLAVKSPMLKINLKSAVESLISTYSQTI